MRRPDHHRPNALDTSLQPRRRPRNATDLSCNRHRNNAAITAHGSVDISLNASVRHSSPASPASLPKTPPPDHPASVRQRLSTKTRTAAWPRFSPYTPGNNPTPEPPAPPTYQDNPHPAAARARKLTDNASRHTSKPHAQSCRTNNNKASPPMPPHSPAAATHSNAAAPP